MYRERERETNIIIIYDTIYVYSMCVYLSLSLYIYVYICIYDLCIYIYIYTHTHTLGGASGIVDRHAWRRPSRRDIHETGGRVCDALLTVACMSRVFVVLTLSFLSAKPANWNHCNCTRRSRVPMRLVPKAVPFQKYHHHHHRCHHS